MQKLKVKFKGNSDTYLIFRYDEANMVFDDYILFHHNGMDSSLFELSFELGFECVYNQSFGVTSIKVPNDKITFIGLDAKGFGINK